MENCRYCIIRIFDWNKDIIASLALHPISSLQNIKITCCSNNLAPACYVKQISFNARGSNDNIQCKITKFVIFQKTKLYYSWVHPNVTMMILMIWYRTIEVWPSCCWCPELYLLTNSGPGRDPPGRARGSDRPHTGLDRRARTLTSIFAQTWITWYLDKGLKRDLSHIKTKLVSKYLIVEVLWFLFYVKFSSVHS